jgi:hypothetical protein
MDMKEGRKEGRKEGCVWREFNCLMLIMGLLVARD